jgi:hypothetical protein
MSSNCDCNAKDTTSVKCTQCNYNYLKPITYDDLFDEKSNKCTDYNLIIKKLTEARNSFFLFQTAIYNFINDCTRLKQKIRDDNSGNDLKSLTFDYIVLMNNLIAEIALGMRKKIKEDNMVLLNFEVPITQANKTIEDIQNLWPTNIIYTDTANVDTLIASLPSVTVYLTESMQLQVKIISPKSLSYSNLCFDNSYVKSHQTKLNDVFIKNMTPELELIDTTYGFSDSEHANYILEDLINYYCDINIDTHNLKDVVDRLEGIILSIANSHRSIIQKIKTEKIAEQNKCAK